MKLIVLILGIAIGFGAGIYYGVHHPTQAQTLSDEEQRRFIQAQIKISEAVKAKLDQMATKSSTKTPGSGFLGGSSTVIPPAEISQLRDDQDQQLKQLRQRLDKLNK